MKEEMYTYQYYKHRSITRPGQPVDLLVPGLVLFGLVYALMTVFVTFRS